MSHRRTVVWLFVAGLIVHGLAAAAVYRRGGSIDAYAFSSLDCGEYYNLARNLAGNATFSARETQPLIPDTWRTPGYPLFLAAYVLVFGPSPTTLIFLQQVLAVLNVAVFFRIACRHTSPRRAAIAAVLLLFEPYGLYYSFWLLSTTWFTTLLLATWWAFDLANANRRLGWYVTTGLLCGLLVLTWPGAILVPVGVVVGILMAPLGSCAALMPNSPFSPLPLGEDRIENLIGSNRAGSVSDRSVVSRDSQQDHALPLGVLNERPNTRVRRLPAVAVFLICCAIVIASWMARNLCVAGHFSLSHQSGVVLAYFKATEVELWRLGRMRDRYAETSLNSASADLPHLVWDEIDAELRKRLRGHTPDDVAQLRWPNLAQGNKTPIDSFEISRALTEIAWRYFSQSPWATALCCASRIGENLIFPLGLAIEQPAGVQANRVRSAALGTAYSLLTVFAVAGVVRARRRWPIVFFPVACIVALALTTTPQVDPRFRVPLIPMLLFVAILPGQATDSKVYSSRRSSS